jgi:hypothetical protein
VADGWTSQLDPAPAMLRPPAEDRPTPTRPEIDVLTVPRAHRIVVITRLLDKNLSVDCLRTLLPEWSTLIEDIANGVTDPERPDAWYR